MWERRPLWERRPRREGSDTVHPASRSGDRSYQGLRLHNRSSVSPNR